MGERIVPPHADVLRCAASRAARAGSAGCTPGPAPQADLLAAARQHHGDVRHGCTAGAELIEAGWFGPVVSPPVAARYGDVALVPHAPISFHDPADTGPYPAGLSTRFADVC